MRARPDPPLCRGFCAGQAALADFGRTAAAAGTLRKTVVAAAAGFPVSILQKAGADSRARLLFIFKPEESVRTRPSLGAQKAKGWHRATLSPAGNIYSLESGRAPAMNLPNRSLRDVYLAGGARQKPPPVY